MMMMMISKKPIITRQQLRACLEYLSLFCTRFFSSMGGGGKNNRLLVPLVAAIIIIPLYRVWV